jgi:FMN phosphatase YigB (HAD superfamily)
LLMIKALLFDFSRVILFPKDGGYSGELNSLHDRLAQGRTYRFWDYFELNQELLDWLTGLKGRFGLYIFTTGNIQKNTEVLSIIQPIFQKIYTVGEIGISKKDPDAYRKIVADIGLFPEEIMFIDDQKSNIEAAEKAGLIVFHFVSNSNLFDEIERKTQPV